MDKELAAINSSGEIGNLQLGDINLADKVLKKSEIDAAIKVTDDKIAPAVKVVDDKIPPIEAAVSINAGNIAGIIDGTGVITATKYETGVANPTEVEGTQFYDDAKHVVSYYTDIPGVTANGVLEDLVRVEANDTTTITNGTPVYFDHTVSASNIPRVKRSNAGSLSTARVGGVATHDVANGTEGWMTTRGTISDLNFALLAESGITLVIGDDLFISATEAGKYTNVAPDLTSAAGTIIKMSTGTTDGVMFVEPRSLVSSIVVYSYLRGLDVPGYNLTSGVSQDITGYTLNNSLLLTGDTTQGIVSTLTAGVYDMSLSAKVSLDAGYVAPQNDIRVVQLEIRDRTGNNTDILTMHMHFSEAQDTYTGTVSDTIECTGDEEWIVRIIAIGDNINLDVDAITFDVKSRNLG